MMGIRVIRRLSSRCPVQLVLRSLATSSAGGGGGGGSGPGGGGAGSDAGGGSASEEYCYTLGVNGILRFPMKDFVPLDRFVQEFDTFEQVPDRRLISTVNANNPFLTTSVGKKWVRSALIPPLLARDKGVSLLNALTDGNVGVLKGVHIVVFRELKVVPAGCPAAVAAESTEAYPYTMRGAALFLLNKLPKCMTGLPSSRLPIGLQELLTYATTVPQKNYQLVPYHPEFFSPRMMWYFYIEVHRVLRKEMPAQNEAVSAYYICEAIGKAMPSGSAICKTDPMLKLWGKLHKTRSLAAKLRIPVSDDSELDMNNLSKKEVKEFRQLMAKAYGSASHGGGGNTQGTSTSTYYLPSGEPIPPYPIEAKVIDTVRHAMIHMVEEDSVSQAEKLHPKDPQYLINLQKEPMKWEDVVMLAMHLFPNYHHLCCVTFRQHRVWDKLDLLKQLPLPSVYHLSSFESK